MSNWQKIETAPKGQWVIVSWDGDVPGSLEYGPWDYGMRRYKLPPPPAMVAIYIESEGDWRAYSEDGGIYGAIPTPTRWMEIPS